VNEAETIVQEFEQLRRAAAEESETGSYIPVNIAVFTSLRGTMAKNEIALARAYLLAIKAVNSSDSGQFSRKYRLLPRLFDGESQNDEFRKHAVSLGRMDANMRVHAICGTWTSAARKTIQAVLNVLEKPPLFFYPNQFEGLESNPYTIYMGAIPNQQVFPVMKLYGRTDAQAPKMGDFTNRKRYDRFHIIGSDYIYPRAVFEQMKRRFDAYGKTADVQFVPFVARGMYPTESTSEHADHITHARAAIDKTIDKLASHNTCPDVIFNFLNGDANHYLFHRLSDVSRKGAVEMPSTVSFSMTLEDLVGTDTREDLTAQWDNTGHHFMAASYFSDGDDFSRYYSEATGSIPNDAEFNAFTSILAYAKAIEEIGTHSSTILLDRIKSECITAKERREMANIDSEESGTFDLHLSISGEFATTLQLHAAGIDEHDIETLSLMASRGVKLRKVLSRDGSLMIATTVDDNHGLSLCDLQGASQTERLPVPYPSEEEFMHPSLHEHVRQLEGEQETEYREFEQSIRRSWRDYSHYVYILGDVIPELRVTHHLRDVDVLRDRLVESKLVSPEALANLSWIQSIRSTSHSAATLDRLSKLAGRFGQKTHKVEDAYTQDVSSMVIKVTNDLLLLRLTDTDVSAVLEREPASPSVVAKGKALSYRMQRVYLFDLLHHCSVAHGHDVYLNGALYREPTLDSDQVQGAPPLMMDNLQPVVDERLKWELRTHEGSERSVPEIVYSAMEWQRSPDRPFVHWLDWEFHDSDGPNPHQLKSVTYRAYTTGEPDDRMFDFGLILEESPSGYRSLRSLLWSFRYLFGDHCQRRGPIGGLNLREGELTEPQVSGLDLNPKTSQLWMRHWKAPGGTRMALAGGINWTFPDAGTSTRRRRRRAS